jgi:hypothetical protein
VCVLCDCAIVRASIFVDLLRSIENFLAHMSLQFATILNKASGPSYKEVAMRKPNALRLCHVSSRVM